MTSEDRAKVERIREQLGLDHGVTMPDQLLLLRLLDAAEARADVVEEWKKAHAQNSLMLLRDGQAAVAALEAECRKMAARADAAERERDEYKQSAQTIGETAHALRAELPELLAVEKAARLVAAQFNKTLIMATDDPHERQAYSLGAHRAFSQCADIVNEPLSALDKLRSEAGEAGDLP